MPLPLLDRYDEVAVSTSMPRPQPGPALRPRHTRHQAICMRGRVDDNSAYIQCFGRRNNEDPHRRTTQGLHRRRTQGQEDTLPILSTNPSQAPDQRQKTSVAPKTVGFANILRAAILTRGLRAIRIDVRHAFYSLKIYPKARHVTTFKF